MEIRGILQTEIWSKETSRKILRVVKRTLAVVGVLVVVVVSWNAVSDRWLTRSEQRIARVALSQIDALQYLDRLSDEEYAAQYKEAQASVHAAEQVAWTGRDGSIAAVLATYLMSTDVRRSEKKSILKLSASNDDRARKFAQSESQYEVESISLDGIQSMVLHEALK